MSSLLRLNVSDVPKNTSFAGKMVQGKVHAVGCGHFLFGDTTGVMVVSHQHELGDICGKRLQIVLTDKESVTVFPCPILVLTSSSSLFLLTKQTSDAGAPHEPVPSSDFRTLPKPGLLTFTASFIHESDAAILVFDEAGLGFSVRLWSQVGIDVPESGIAVFTNLSVRESKIPPQVFSAHFDTKAGSCCFLLRSTTPVKLTRRIDMLDKYLEVNSHVGKLVSIQGFAVSKVTSNSVPVKGKQQQIETLEGAFPGTNNSVSFTLWNQSLFGRVMPGDVIRANFVTVKVFKSAPSLQSCGGTEIIKTSKCATRTVQESTTPRFVVPAEDVAELLVPLSWPAQKKQRLEQQPEPKQMQRVEQQPEPKQMQRVEQQPEKQQANFEDEQRLEQQATSEDERLEQQANSDDEQ